ncbi:DUF5305 domain-containing protein [Halobacteria archaeon AArc-dxtr1]|nr:DUF5305 domain-containing protein [Halobacteria archaeon AArc-dxtr1]
MIDSPRFDLLVAKHGRTLFIALIAIGLLALLTTGWVFATPSTSTTTEDANEQTVSTDVTHGATVVQDGAWEAGTELTDSPIYRFDDTPELTLDVTTSVPTEETNVTHTVELVYEADRDGDEIPAIGTTQTVVRADPAVADGEATTNATIDAPEMHEEYFSIEESLAGMGSVSVSIVVTTEYDTGTYIDEQQASTPVEITNETYWLPDSLSASETHSQTQTVEVSEPRSSGLVAGLGLIAVLAFGLAALVSSRSDTDEEAARRAVHEQRYAEWISRGSLPMWVGEHHVSLDTLEDVVDVAIDTNERVVNDRQRGLFAVVDDGVVYYYSERGLWEETAWPEMNIPAAAQGEAGPPSEDSPLPFDSADGSPTDGDDSVAFRPDDLDLEEFDDGDDEEFDDDDVWQQF